VRERIRLACSFRLRYLKPVIGVVQGLTDPVCGLNMGQTAEVLSREFHITRSEQDAFALQSHERALAAIREDRLAEEIQPVPIPPRFDTMHEVDSGPREGQSIEALQKLRPYFDRHNGTVTVGNACPLTDGAAAVVMMSESAARARGLEPLGYLRDYAYAGLDPSRMGLGPVFATAKVLEQVGLTLADMDLIELNEAFAAQVLACARAFESDAFAKTYLGRDTALGTLDLERVNVNGGAIALGHPVGTTGTRLVLTLLREMKRRGVDRGLATLCIGGGQGAALILERT
jgi:acetyl-CoA acetyltransferase family protein